MFIIYWGVKPNNNLREFFILGKKVRIRKFEQVRECTARARARGREGERERERERERGLY